MTTTGTDYQRVRDPLDAIKTYRYLRIAMVLLVVALGAAVALEWREVGRACFQTSISAYYYTPVRGMFIAALVAIGVCMVVLKGSTLREDALLNVAGVLAPVVAFVPTSSIGACSSAPGSSGGRTADVANNMGAYFLVLGATVLVTAALLSREPDTTRRGHRVEWTGVVASGVGILSAFAIYAARREMFLEHAHNAAAVLMFACVIVVVVINARGLDERRSGHPGQVAAAKNRYGVLATAMVLTAPAVLAYRALWGLDHWVLWVEALLIGLFAVFWAVQTADLWDTGLRPEAVDDLPPGIATT